MGNIFETTVCVSIPPGTTGFTGFTANAGSGKQV
jgi:hypothetical protein